MYKPSTYLVGTYFPTYLLIYSTYFFTKWVSKVKPDINSVEVHLQLSHNGHPVDGALVGAGSGCCPERTTRDLLNLPDCEGQTMMELCSFHLVRTFWGNFCQAK
jgi:hypothetical protein